MGMPRKACLTGDGIRLGIMTALANMNTIWIRQRLIWIRRGLHRGSEDRGLCKHGGAEDRGTDYPGKRKEDWPGD